MTETVKDLLDLGFSRLQPILGDTAATDIRALLAHALGVDRGLLAARSHDSVTAKQIAVFMDAIEQRAQGNYDDITSLKENARLARENHWVEAWTYAACTLSIIALVLALVAILH